VNVIAAEDERDVVSEVGLSGNVDTEQRSGFHKHDPVGDELNLVPGLQNERPVAQRLEVVTGKFHLKIRDSK
jgi:hypothetical protein